MNYALTSPFHLTGAHKEQTGPGSLRADARVGHQPGRVGEDLSQRDP